MRYVIPGAVGLLYATQGIYHLTKREYGFALMWLAYAAANVGIMIAMTEGTDR